MLFVPEAEKETPGAVVIFISFCYCIVTGNVLS